MRRRHVSLYAAVAIFLWAAPAPADEKAGDQPAMPAAELQQMRDDFIRDFQRIGLNTTPGVCSPSRSVAS